MFGCGVSCNSEPMALRNENCRGSLQVHPKFGPCDLEIIRPRMERALGSLGKKELDEARMQEGQLDLKAI